MGPVGAYITNEPIFDGTAVSMVLPAAPNMVFLTSRGDLTKHSGLASANQIQYFKCMNGLCFSAVSLSLPHHRRDNGTPGAVSNGSGSTLTSVTLGGILAACFAVLLLFFVPCYLKRRRRYRQRTPVSEAERGVSRQASFKSGSFETMSISRSHYLPQRNSISASPNSQPSPKTAALVISQGLPSPKVTDDWIRNALLPTRPAPLPPSIECASREAQRGDFHQTAVAISPPASPPSRVTDGRTRKASLPARPAPLLLPPERPVRGAQESDTITVAMSRTIGRTNGDNRGSLLPNPWDGDAKPKPAASEWAILQLPSFIAPVRPANIFEVGAVGLPRTPRGPRNSVPKVRPLVTEDVADGLGVKRRQRVLI